MRTTVFLICLISLLIQPVLADYDDCTSGDIVYVWAGYSGLSFGTYNAPDKTISAGITRAVNSGKSCVYVADGTYNEKIECADGVNVYGGFNHVNWSWTHDPDTYISKITGSGLSGNEQIHFYYDDDVEFDGFVVEHGVNFSYAIYAYKSDNLIISNNTFRKNNNNTSACAVYLENSSGYIESNTVYSDSTDWYKGLGIYIPAKSWHIKWNTVSDCSFVGIAQSMASAVGSISDNEIEYCEVGIINSWNANSVHSHVRRNNITHCTKGIETGLWNATYIDSNIIEDFSNYGIMVNSGLENNENKVYQNKLKAGDNTASIGIEITSSAHIKHCSFNWIFDCDKGISVEKDCTVKENGIIGCNTGIEINHSSGVMYIENNSINHPENYGIYLASTQTTKIVNNILNGTGTEPGSGTGLWVPTNHGTLTIEYNDVYNFYALYQNCSAGTGCFSDNPKFISILNGTWYSDWQLFLKQPPCQNPPYSPCVDAGSPNYDPFGTTKTNLDPDTGVIDMGAHLPILEQKGSNAAFDYRTFYVSDKPFGGMETMRKQAGFGSEWNPARTPQEVMKFVAAQLNDPDSSFYAESEKILIWIDGQKFPWLVEVQDIAFQ